MLAPEPGSDRLRATYLGGLAITALAFQPAHDPSPVADDPMALPDNMGDQLPEKDFSQVSLVANLLHGAPNHRELSMEQFQPCLLRCPRIGEAFAAFHQLAYLRLSTLADDALRVL